MGTRHQLANLLKFQGLAPISGLSAALSLALLAGCGDISSNSNLAASATACTANTAQIGIGDGFVQNLCGCGGTSGQVITPPQSFTCNVSAVGTTVFFHYLGTRLTHQIAPAGAAGGAGSADAFAMSPISDPTDKTPVRVHAIKLSVSGTYSFVDLYTPQLKGSIVVP